MNEFRRIMRIVAMIAVAIALPVRASSLEQSASIEQAIISAASKSQRVIEGSSDTAEVLQSEIDSLQAEINNLEVYQGHLDKLIESQNRELSGLDLQLAEITETRQGVIPLMYEMLAGLEEYILHDMPIYQQARIERIDKLKRLMTTSGVSDAEKYRRILEAYQIELDYVNKLGSYTGAVEIAGIQREVELLYLGHIAFIARSLDHQAYWYWAQKQQGWVALESGMNSELERAFLVANKQLSPSLLMLPLSLQGVSQ